jgi:hypothetical protein
MLVPIFFGAEMTFRLFRLSTLRANRSATRGDFHSPVTHSTNL